MRFFCFIFSFILLLHLLLLLLVHLFRSFTCIFFLPSSSSNIHFSFLRLGSFGFVCLFFSLRSLCHFGNMTFFVWRKGTRIKMNEVWDTFTFITIWVMACCVQKKNGVIIVWYVWVYLLRWRRAIAARAAIRVFQISLSSFFLSMCL